MKTKLSMSIAAATLFAALSAGTIVRADEDKVEIKGLNEAKVTLAQAITNAETKAGGKAYDAKITSEGGAALYVVEVFSADKIQKVEIDTQSGEVLKVEAMSEDYDGDGDGQ